MSIAGKIRFLLLILGACCIGTALSLKNTISKKDLLTHEAAELQENLHQKENIVNDFLSDPQKIEQAKVTLIEKAKKSEKAICWVSSTIPVAICVGAP